MDPTVNQYICKKNNKSGTLVKKLSYARSLQATFAGIVM